MYKLHTEKGSRSQIPDCTSETPAGGGGDREKSWSLENKTRWTTITHGITVSTLCLPCNCVPLTDWQCVKSLSSFPQNAFVESLNGSSLFEQMLKDDPQANDLKSVPEIAAFMNTYPSQFSIVYKIISIFNLKNKQTWDSLTLYLHLKRKWQNCVCSYLKLAWLSISADKLR